MRASQPRSAAAWARATASEVVSAEMEATTGPPLWLWTASTQVHRTCNFSSQDNVAPSPNDPRATIPVQPFSSSHRQCSAMNLWSTPRSSVKLVVIAGITPFQFIDALLLCMVSRFLLTCRESKAFDADGKLRRPHRLWIPLQREIQLLVCRRVPGMVPCRNESEVLHHAMRCVGGGGRSEQLRNDK